MSRALRTSAFVALAWSVIGWLQGTQVYLGMATEMAGHIEPYHRFVLWQVGSWLCWAVLTPVVVALARRFPLSRRAGAVAVHAAASLLVPLARIAGVTVVSRLVRPFGAETIARPFGAQYAGALMGYFTVDVLVYWAVVGVVAAVDSRRRLRERELQATRAEAQLASARLANLQLQLQPHFLFNTLHAIAGLVRENEPKAAVTMISGLSDLLRYALDNAGRSRVPLSEELQVAAQYLGIQRMRFSDRLRAEIDATDEAREAAVPTLLLQPLLENAVQHGVAISSEPARVRVTARREAGMLVVEVHGDGPPLRPDWREREGVGLSSTRRRLETLYGAGGTLALEDSGGTVVARVTLPFSRELDRD